MTLKGHLFSSTRIAGVRASANELRTGRLMRDPEVHVDPTDPPEGETDEQKAAREAAEAAAASSTQTAEETAAALAAANEELEAARARLAEFDGIDAAAARENAKKVSEAEKAKVEAEKAARKAEKERAQAENDVAKLREIQAAEHEAAINAVTAERDAARAEAQDVRSEISRLRTENAFANSKFITEDTILSPAKAQRLFGDYVDVVDGKVVVYDAPRGDEKRAKIQDSKGNALPFNDAIAKVVNADPDKDELLKSKTKPGASTKTTDGKPTPPSKSRHERLTAGLAALREKHTR